MAEIAKAYVQIIPSTEGIEGSLEKALGGEANKAGNNAGKKAGGAFSSAMGAAAKVGVAAVGAASTAAAGFVKSAVDGYGEYQQLVGGVETLFGTGGATLDQYAASVNKSASEVAEEYTRLQDAQNKVLDNASNAFATAGMSANDYMETVTSFSASLLQSVEGDTVKAADIADMAIIDMSDNANKMGTSMESIQNAYQGFAKQNYTMLDNLKLGYGGTKSEMERLLEDAGRLSGIEYNIDSLSDVYEAIHVVQQEMGIAGTTGKEAASTIQGSMSSVMAAWSNLTTGMATEGADIDKLINDFVSNLGTFAENMLPTIETALSGLAGVVSKLAPIIAQELPKLIETALPGLLSAGVEVIKALAQGILDSLPTLMPTVVEVILQLGQMLIEMAPQLIEAAAEIILQLAMGLAQALPTLIPTIVEVILTIQEYLVDNIDLLVDAAIELMKGLGIGFIKAIPILVEKIPIIISKLISAIVENGPRLLSAGKELIMNIATGLVVARELLLIKMRSIMSDLKQAVIEKIKDFVSAGAEIINGIKQGIVDAWDDFKDWFNEKIGGLVDGIKDFLKIGSPSKVFANEVGRWIPAGIAEGIENGMGVLDSAMDDMNDHLMGGAYSASATLSASMDSARMYNSAPMAADNNNSVLDLLATYLPLIASGENMNITLEGDANRLFRVMQAKAENYQRTTGQNAFA